MAPGSYWLTGSQSYKPMTLAQESLAGRIALLNLTSLSQHELYAGGSLIPFEIKNSGIAYHNLGICYENGQGVRKDYKKAIEMYGKAVENGEKAGLIGIQNVYVKMGEKKE